MRELGYRVISSRSQRAATAEPPDGIQDPLAGAVSFYRLVGVVGTGRRVAAIAPEIGGDRRLIKAQSTKH